MCESIRENVEMYAYVPFIYARLYLVTRFDDLDAT